MVLEGVAIWYEPGTPVFMSQSIRALWLCLSGCLGRVRVLALPQSSHVPYRGTSLIRRRPHLQDHHRALRIGLL